MEAAKNIEMVPAGYTTVTPWIISRSTEKMIAFLEAVFNAVEIPNSKITDGNGAVIHVVVKIGDALIMLFDAKEGWGPTPAYLNFYVSDVEKAHSIALERGAVSVTDITTLWFGERVCRILDPFGNLFWINERVEELDFTDPQVSKKAATSEAVSGIQYIQQSLDLAMQMQNEQLKRQYSDISF